MSPAYSPGVGSYSLAGLQAVLFSGRPDKAGRIGWRFQAVTRREGSQAGFASEGPVLLHNAHLATLPSLTFSINRDAVRGAVCSHSRPRSSDCPSRSSCPDGRLAIDRSGTLVKIRPVEDADDPRQPWSPCRYCGRSAESAGKPGVYRQPIAASQRATTSFWQPDHGARPDISGAVRQRRGLPR